MLQIVVGLSHNVMTAFIPNRWITGLNSDYKFNIQYFNVMQAQYVDSAFGI